MLGNEERLNRHAQEVFKSINFHLFLHLVISKLYGHLLQYEVGDASHNFKDPLRVYKLRNIEAVVSRSSVQTVFLKISQSSQEKHVPESLFQ